MGVAGALTRRTIENEKGEQFGKALEHFILMELLAYRSYKELHYDINFWRTKSGLEVDFILGGGEVALEVKGSGNVDSKDMKPLKAFIEDNDPGKAIIACNEARERVVDGIRVMPWREFLTALWSGALW